MLVLTRKEGEKILIGENISITIVKSKNGQVRIGIDAPKGINIRREELENQVEKQEQPSSEKKIA